MHTYLQSLIKKGNASAGFTLTNLVVTIGIMGTLSTVSLSKYDDALAAARDANRLINLHQVQTALSIYYLDHDAYPACGNNNKATTECYLALEGLIQPSYMPEVPKDPLNREAFTYQYYSDVNTAFIEFETEDSSDASPRKVFAL